MENETPIRAAIISVIVLSCCANGVDCAGSVLDMERSYCGVTFLASNIGKNVSSDEILRFVNTCRVDFVLIDFA